MQKKASLEQDQTHQGEDKPSPLLCYEAAYEGASIVGAMACPRPGAARYHFSSQSERLFQLIFTRLTVGL